MIEKEIKRIITDMVNSKWITLNKNLNPEAVTILFVDLFKEIKLKDYLEIFTPRF